MVPILALHIPDGFLSVPVALVYSFFVEYYVAGMTGALKE